PVPLIVAVAIALAVGLFGVYMVLAKRDRGTEDPEGAWVYTQRPGSAAIPDKSAAQWRKNWETINESVPRMGSSEGYSATNRERTLAVLAALDLASDPLLSKEREELVALIQRAPARPEDPTYNMRVPEGYDVKFESLKRGIRN